MEQSYSSLGEVPAFGYFKVPNPSVAVECRKWSNLGPLRRLKWCYRLV